jgi:hypothetical protein
MLSIGTSVRRGLASLIAAVLCVPVAGSPLAACPFMQSKSAQAGMPCCPRKPVPAKHCPVSSDLQVCPFYSTDSKIAIAKDKFQMAKLSLAPSPVIHAIWQPAAETTKELAPPVASDLSG